MSGYDDAVKMLDEKLGNKEGPVSLSVTAPEPGADGKAHPAA